MINLELTEKELIVLVDSIDNYITFFNVMKIDVSTSETTKIIADIQRKLIDTARITFKGREDNKLPV